MLADRQMGALKDEKEVQQSDPKPPEGAADDCADQMICMLIRGNIT
jgi:hypothetical protein